MFMICVVVCHERVTRGLAGQIRTLTRHAETTPATAPRRHRKPRGQQGQQGRDLCLARLHLHPRAQVFVYAAQRFCCTRLVVLAAGHAGHLAQGGFVQLQVDGHVFGHRAVATRAALLSAEVSSELSKERTINYADEASQPLCSQ